MEALGAARLHCPDEASVRQRLVNKMSSRHRFREVGVARGIEVDDQMGCMIGLRCQCQCWVVFDGSLVGKPQQCAAIVAEGIGNGPFGCLGPYRRGRHPVGRVLRHILLHEWALTTRHPYDGQGPILQLGDDAIVHGVEIVHQLALRYPGTVEQGLIEIRELNPGTAFGLWLVCHQRSVPPCPVQASAVSRVKSSPAAAPFSFLSKQAKVEHSGTERRAAFAVARWMASKPRNG